MSKKIKKRPKLIVFDLDYTLWPFWMHSQVNPPFSKSVSGAVLDSKGITIKHYEEVPKVLETLKQKGYVLAIASRTPKVNSAQQLIELFDWNKYFTYKEIYPGRKTMHFSKVRTQSGIQFDDMLFFDDELRNIYDLRSAGVVSVLVRDGVNQEIVNRGLKDYAHERSFK
ncbi:hypothetical protein RN001_009840 [Aquatica leii]|uniref:Magnesium-dependent phosphatase 1 n=1 Tax=Aquatica leii TaxID=1421715 RepID=A0AAN7SFT9_9COLE|nr:hypothetical protein RN001_009840 [Aquatica leii]